MPYWLLIRLPLFTSWHRHISPLKICLWVRAEFLAQFQRGKRAPHCSWICSGEALPSSPQRQGRPAASAQRGLWRGGHHRVYGVTAGQSLPTAPLPQGSAALRWQLRSKLTGAAGARKAVAPSTGPKAFKNLLRIMSKQKKQFLCYTLLLINSRQRNKSHQFFPTRKNTSRSSIDSFCL